MAGKKKGKGKKKAANNALREAQELAKAPHTFVVHRGHVGNNVSTLTQNMRQIMEPYTASNLKLRKKNVLKDMVAIAGPLGVTNFLMFSKTPNGTNLRIARLPRGPTLYFQVMQYSLCHDIVSSLKRPQTFEGQYRHPPLLVLNNFKDPPNGDNAKSDGNFQANPRKLCVSMFQNMFPSINIHKVKLSQVKRCVSFSYDREKDVIEFRHYNIAVKPMGMSRRMRKLLMRNDLPDLGKYGDISEYLTQLPGDGSASESEVEGDGPHNEVEVSQDVGGKGNIVNQQSAIRLTELGPRLTLKLVKIEEGMCDGEVLYHSLITKTKEEIEETLKLRKEKEKLKSKRKAEQARNVAKKKEEKEELKKKSIRGMKRKNPEDNVEDDDAEWYRKEVGEDPDEQLISGAKKRKIAKNDDSTLDEKTQNSDKSQGVKFKKKKKNAAGHPTQNSKVLGIKNGKKTNKQPITDLTPAKKQKVTKKVDGSSDDKKQSNDKSQGFKFKNKNVTRKLSQKSKVLGKKASLAKKAKSQ